MSVNYIVRFSSEAALGWVPYKVPWTSQPLEGTVIDSSNPLARDLAAYFPFHYPTQRDQTGRVASIPNGGPVRSPHDGYQATYLARTTNEKITINKTALFDVVGKEAWTVSIWANFDGSAGSSHDLVTQWRYTGGVKTFTLTGPHNTDVAFFGIFEDGGGSPYIQGTTNLATATGWHHIVATLVDGVRMRLYVDGVKEAEDLSINIINTTASESLWAVGGQVDYDTNLYKGWLRDFGFWTRELQEAEVKSLYEDPWQIFEPRTMYVPVT